MLGILRGKRVGRDEFAKPFTDGLNFLRRDRAARRQGHDVRPHRQWRARRRPGCDLDGGSREPRPGPVGTRADRAGAARDEHDSKGGPFFADPRQVLRHAMKPLHGHGTHRGRRDRARVLPARGNSDSPTPKVGNIPGIATVQAGPQYGAWRTSRTSTRSSRSSSPSARRRTSRSARRSRSSHPASSRSIFITWRSAELAATTACC